MSILGIMPCARNGYDVLATANKTLHSMIAIQETAGGTELPGMFKSMHQKK